MSAAGGAVRMALLAIGCQCGGMNWRLVLVRAFEPMVVCFGIGGEENTHPIRGAALVCPSCARSYCLACSALAHHDVIGDVETTSPPPILRAIARAEAAAAAPAKKGAGN